MTDAMVMPAGYAVIDEEEMTYLDGGGIRCNVLAGIIDASICIATLGGAALSKLATSAGKHALKKNWHKIVQKVARVLAWVGGVNEFLGFANNILNAANNASYWLNFSSIGGVIAYGIDLFDSNRRNCVAFG